MRLTQTATSDNGDADPPVDDENDLEDIANERGDVSNQYLGKIRFIQISLLILSIIKHLILYLQVCSLDLVVPL